MPAPDERLTIDIGPLNVDRPAVPRGTDLTVPFAERAGCAVRAPGVAVLGHSEESLNASNTLNGGLIALACEEAALSLSPGSTLASLDLRYLQPVRVGPAVAEAEVRNGLGRIEVRDAGTTTASASWPRAGPSATERRRGIGELGSRWPNSAGAGGWR